jgi:hypothetical protein
MKLKNNDRGVAMVSVLMATMITTTTVIAAYNVSRHELNRTTQGHRKLSSIGAAEAGLDLALSMLGSAPLPCNLTGQLNAEPLTATYSVSIAYYATYPVTGSALTCTQGSGPSGLPAAALLVSNGQAGDTATARTMEALARLTAAPTGSMDKAMFSDRSFAPTNNVTLYGNVGNDADIYTNGNFSCSNNQVIRGSVYSQGTLTASNNCTVDVDYVARGNITASQNVTVGHDMRSSRGNITMYNSARVNHDAVAFGTNTGGTVVNNRVSGATVADPPAQVLPTVNFDAQDWQDAGWTRQINAGSNCTQAYDEIAAMSSQTVPTVVITTCALTWSGNTTITLGADLAVFSTGGFTARNNFRVRSDNSTVRKFYLVVPSSSATSNCTSPGITLQNNTTFESTVNTMFFTPCRVSIQNNDGGYGQIYAGLLEVSNHFTLRYRPASVPGVEWTGSTIYNYMRDLVYKREIMD